MSTASQSCFIGHTTLKNKCKHCNTFKSDWYNQLESHGFNDIEKRKHDHDSIDEIRVRHRDLHSQITYEATFNYYQWARDKATKGKFASENDFFIWHYHASGHSQYQIAKKLDYNQSWISKKLNKIEHYLSINSASMSFGHLNHLTA